ncbi:MAG: Na+/H+ antiporter NhaA [Hyphomicrobiaceae bacterium]
MTIDEAGTRPRSARGALAFFQHEAAGGVVMMIAAALALVASNSALAPLYAAFVDTPVTLRAGALLLDKPLLHWINDGLMAIFFCLVGLEIKRELKVGELSTLQQALLPALGALGGMIVPGLIYYLVNMNNPVALNGWAIPTATDIAFAVTVLSLVGSGVPPALKVFLLALAIIDDLGAIVIIAVFYTTKLSAVALGLAAVGAMGLLTLNLLKVKTLTPYVLVGVFVWVCVLKSGVHATLAGVLVGLAIPIVSSAGEKSPLERLEHQLHPWVAFGVLPLFGFANAGVPLGGVTFADLLSPVTMGIALGLVLGKPIGILGACWLAGRLGLGRLRGASWQHLVGVSMLAGIGFTMSLFIGILAFDDASFATSVRLGVLTASFIAAAVGYTILVRAKPVDEKLSEGAT